MSRLEIALEANSAAAAAGARSRVYAALARGFGFPAPDLASEVAAGSWLAELTAAFAHLPFQPALSPEGAAALSDPGLDYAAMQQAYIALFEVGLGQPFCPLYEGSHREGRMRLMEDIVRFLEHFGLKPQPGDQPDHLCAELEFMHYLSFKQAASLAAGRPAGGLDRAQADFLSRHLCRWLPAVRALLDSEAGACAFYRALAGFAAGFCAADLANLKEVSGKVRR